MPVVILVAACLMTPTDLAPRFDVIRAAAVDPGHMTPAAALTILAAACLGWGRPAQRSLVADTLIAGLLVPISAYLLLRLLADLPGAAIPAWCGFVLVLGGGAMAVIQGWRGASHLDIDGAAVCLTQRQAGLAMAGVGLTLVARAADLPSAASFALAATLLSVVVASIAGTLTSLAAHTIGVSAGTYRLSRLGGLAQTMPETSAVLTVGILGLSAIPPGLGFASLWLLFQSILSSPRTGGLLIQLPLALIGAAIALSAALATASFVRLIGIAVLGRPRTPRGASARESKTSSRVVLIVLAGLSLLMGILPGPSLWLLADPAIRALTGAHSAVAWISPSTAAPGYLALPVLALLGLATGGVMWVQRWSRKEAKIAGPWTNGMAPPIGLPFGEPAAQANGEGFLPALPEITLPQLPRLPELRAARAPSATMGLWLILTGFGALLLVLAVIS